MTSDQLAETVVVVTGAGRGIGRAIAERAAAKGAHVGIIDIDGDAARQVSTSLAADGHQCVSVAADVGDEAQVRDAFAEIRATLGPVQVVVNNAAKNTTFDLLSTSLAEWDGCLRNTLTSAFLCIRETLPPMIERGGGVVVNVGSVNAIAMLGCDAYSAAKGGLHALTRSVAVRYGRHGIRCNTVSPATIATDQWAQRLKNRPETFDELRSWYPVGRIGTPADVAEAVTYLASGDSGWVSGTELVVDGGLLAGPVPLLPVLEGRDRNAP